MNNTDTKQLSNLKTNLRYAVKYGVINHGWEQGILWLISTVEEQQKEIERLNESLKCEAAISTLAGQDIYTLEKEIERLKVVEQAYEALKKAI